MLLKEKKVSFLSALAAVILTAFFVAAFYIYAALPPITTYDPLDTGPTVQTKEGGLILNTKMIPDANGLIVSQGNVGIAVPSPAAKLDIGGYGTLHLTPQSMEPSLTAEGSLYYNSMDHKLKVRNNTAWTDVSGGSTSSYASQVLEVDFQLCWAHPRLVCNINTDTFMINCSNACSSVDGCSDPQVAAAWAWIKRSGQTVPSIKNLQTVHAAMVGSSGLKNMKEWSSSRIEMVDATNYRFIVKYTNSGHTWQRLRYSVEASGYTQ